MRRLKKKIFLGLFGGTVALLGLVRLAFPEVTGGEEAEPTLPVVEPVPPRENSSTTTGVLQSDHGGTNSGLSEEEQNKQSPEPQGCVKWHPVRSVPSYLKCFPDVQDVQILAARKWGVRPVRNRKEA